MIEELSNLPGLKLALDSYSNNTYLSSLEKSLINAIKLGDFFRNTFILMAILLGFSFIILLIELFLSFTKIDSNNSFVKNNQKNQNLFHRRF